MTAMAQVINFLVTQEKNIFVTQVIQWIQCMKNVSTGIFGAIALPQQQRICRAKSCLGALDHLGLFLS